MKIVGENRTLKIPAAYGPVLRKISKCHNFCNFWQIAQKSDILYYYDTCTLHKVWLNRIKIETGAEFLKLKNWQFFKVHKMTPNQTQGIGHQNHPTYVKRFIRFALRLACY